MDRVKHEIAKLLLRLGASGVRIHDGGVDAKWQARTIRVEVKEARG